MGHALKINSLRYGLEVTASRDDRHLMMLRLAAGVIEEESFTHRLRENTAPVA